MAIGTLNSHIYTAIQMQQNLNSAYLVIGRKTAWANDNNPPEEDIKTDKLEEIIGYKKLKQYSLARPLNVGETAETAPYQTVTYNGLVWVLIPVEKAYEEKAHWLYVTAEILPTDFPTGMYRQVGVNVGLQPTSGVTKPNLLPTEVFNSGVLLFYENRQPQNRTSSVHVLEKFMIKV